MMILLTFILPMIIVYSPHCRGKFGGSCPRRSQGRYAYRLASGVFSHLRVFATEAVTFESLLNESPLVKGIDSEGVTPSPPATGTLPAGKRDLFTPAGANHLGNRCLCYFQLMEYVYARGSTCPGDRSERIVKSRDAVPSTGYDEGS